MKTMFHVIVLLLLFLIVCSCSLAEDEQTATALPTKEAGPVIPLTETIPPTSMPPMSLETPYPAKTEPPSVLSNIKIDPTNINKLRPMITKEMGEILTIELSPDNTRLAVAEAGGIHIYDVRDFQEQLFVPILGATSISWSTDGARIVSAGPGNRFEIWDTQSGKDIYSKNLNGVNQILWVDWSPTHDYIATSLLSGMLNEPPSTQNFVLSRLAWISGINTHGEFSSSGAFSPNGKYLALGLLNSQVQITDLNLRETKIVNYINYGPITDLSWSTDGNRFAFSGDQWVIIENVENDRDVTHTQFKNVTKSIQSIKWSPGGEMIAVASSSNFFTIWNINTDIKFDLQTSEDHINNVAWLNDGQQIVTGAKEGRLQVWAVDLSVPDNTPTPFGEPRIFFDPALVSRVGWANCQDIRNREHRL